MRTSNVMKTGDTVIRKRAPRLALAFAALTLLLIVADSGRAQGQDGAVVETAGLTVTMSADDHVVWQRGGKTTLRFTLSRPLEAGESVTLPLKVTGGQVGEHWNLNHHAGTAVKRTSHGRKSELVIEAGGQEATLQFVGRKGDRKDRDITIRFGKGNRAPSAVGIDGPLELQGSPLTITVARAKPGQANPVQAPPEPTPLLTIGHVDRIGANEGEDVLFLIKAAPAPASPITVNMEVTEDGSAGASGAMSIVVTEAETIYRVSTTDDDVNESWGWVRAKILPGEGYTVGSPSSVSADVVDNDPSIGPDVNITSAVEEVEEGKDVVFTLTSSPAPDEPIDVTVQVTPLATSDYGVRAGNRTVTIPTSGRATLTVATSDDNVDEPDGSVYATIKVGADYTVGSASWRMVTIKDNDTDTFRVTLYVGGNGSEIIEGQDALYTIKVRPAPTGPLTVNVGVTGGGNFGASGANSITVTEAETTYVVSTTNDNVKEPDGIVSASIMEGQGYSRGWPWTVRIRIRDASTPQVGITSASGTTEGGNATFTLTSDPPAAGLRVTVQVTANGDYGVDTGQRTVTLDSSGSITISVATVDDDNDEEDGSVALTVMHGYDKYVVKGRNTTVVQVADDD